jgi:hypothetical protein
MKEAGSKRSSMWGVQVSDDDRKDRDAYLTSDLIEINARRAMASYGAA